MIPEWISEPSTENIITFGPILVAIAVGLYFWYTQKRSTEMEGDFEIGDDKNLNIGTTVGGIANTGDHVSINEKTPNDKMKELFSSFDGRANNQEGPTVVRMEPHHIQELSRLIAEAGGNSRVEILGYGRRELQSVRMDGTLGVQYPYDEQIQVKLQFRRKLND